MNSTSRSDAELVESILASNKKDFEILMQRYQQKIFAYLYRFLYQNREAAMDVTQDVFIKVYENLGTIDLKRPVQPWIYRIAHNEAANYLRKISRKKESQLMDEQWDTMSNDENTGDLESQENKTLVLKALDKVDPKYREVLVFYYFEEKSYQEIAEIMDSSTNTIGTLIRRAKKQMEKILNDLVGRNDWFFQIVFSFLLITFTSVNTILSKEV